MGASTIIIGGIIIIAGIWFFRQNRKTSPQKAQSDVSVRNRLRLSNPPVATTTPPINQVAARNTFLTNLNRFVPKLHTLSNNTYNKEAQEEWIDEVIDINDTNLINFWKMIFRDGDSVKRVLAQWGIAPDLCSSFQCLSFHSNMYEREDGEALEEGRTYHVISPCWVQNITNESGKNTKIVILKGVVK